MSQRSPRIPESMCMEIIKLGELYRNMELSGRHGMEDTALERRKAMKCSEIERRLCKYVVRRTY